jgi:hypothetical protein
MCYLVRHHQARAGEGGSAPQPPSLDRIRPRWAGAVAAALIGGLAVAAIIAPSSTSSPTLRDRESAAPAPIASSAAAAVPMAAMVETGSAPVDDGVPSTSDVAKAGMGQCHHGL